MAEENSMLKTDKGHPPIYVLCSLFFLMSLVGIAVLIATDLVHHLDFTTLHQRLAAWPLIMIGLSYITLQFALPSRRADKVKGVFLGTAFILWGGEQLLPTSRLVTLMDEAAVTIFVVDVGAIIWGHLNSANGVQLP